MATQLRYDQCPRVYLDPSSHGVFFDALLNANSVHKKMAIFGDSTCTDVTGKGIDYINWLRYYFHLWFGHTPQTQLAPTTSFGGSVPAASWLCMATPTAYAQASAIADSYLLPGHHANGGTIRAYSFYHDSTGGTGFFVTLNHNNDNDATLSALGTNGFYSVSPAIATGKAAYANGTMQGAKSFIDVASGLRAEIVACRRAAGDSTVFWESRPQSLLEWYATNPSAAIVQSGTLFGGAQTLTGALGQAYVGTTSLLNALSGAQRFYAIECESHPTLDDITKSVQIAGVRFKSENVLGRGIDSFSNGGYHSTSISDTHPNSAYMLTAMAHDVSMIGYGINDANVGIAYTSDQFETNLRQIISFIRTTAGLGANHPIILRSQSYRTDVTETADAKKYAGAMYNIAKDTANVMFINGRLILEQDYGWGSGKEGTFLIGGDGVHYLNIGGQVFALATFNGFREALLDGSGRTRNRARRLIRT